ncbi:hypothetical protein P154DRAFT_625170 [Amniculicola lignicola CBS 123094]|uniref:Uncharacterized protein n=1 Tax=Amniculicola lignicola CBS 123094 TaxID=1392246 RepID=A0A6A5VYM4_9PLEO|nr:hypothetical protein P154DRAFT_625170 [Amniculicola lignicola CBS 123094]
MVMENNSVLRSRSQPLGLPSRHAPLVAGGADSGDGTTPRFVVPVSIKVPRASCLHLAGQAALQGGQWADNAARLRLQDIKLDMLVSCGEGENANPAHRKHASPLAADIAVCLYSTCTSSPEAREIAAAGACLAVFLQSGSLAVLQAPLAPIPSRQPRQCPRLPSLTSQPHFVPYPSFVLSFELVLPLAYSLQQRPPQQDSEWNSDPHAAIDLS